MSHPIENIMHSSMQHIKSLADVNTVIGDPLVADDSTMILPVSKVSLGLIVGGGEYLLGPNCKKEKALQELGGEYPFIGASTVGMCLTPLAFLAVREDSVRVLPAKQENPSERLIDLIPQLMQAAERLLGKCGKACEENEDTLGKNAAYGIDRELARAAKSADSAAEKAKSGAERAEKAADKARSAAERAYDTAIEASRAAGRATAIAQKVNDPTGLKKGRTQGAARNGGVKNDAED